jgi:hypothetical protein
MVKGNLPRLCGVCGELLKETDGEYECPSCKRFFWSSPIVQDPCVKCGGMFADSTWAVTRLEGFIGITNIGLWLSMCPTCRRESKFWERAGAEAMGTTCDIIRVMVKLGEVSTRDLVEQYKFPREFIDFCLKKRK